MKNEEQEAAKAEARIKFHERRQLETNEHDFAFLDGFDAGIQHSRLPADDTAIASAVREREIEIADELDEQILSSASTSPHIDLAYYVKKLREDERVVCDHCNRNCGGYHLER